MWFWNPQWDKLGGSKSTAEEDPPLLRRALDRDILSKTAQEKKWRQREGKEGGKCTKFKEGKRMD